MVQKKINTTQELLKYYQANPIAFIEEKLHAHPWEMQQKIINAVRDYPRVTVRSCNGIGKCVNSSSYLNLADGTHVQARDLIGKHFILPTFDSKKKHANAWATNNGNKIVYRITTSSGRQIEVTENHQLYKAVKPDDIRGWTKVSNLKRGDMLLVPSRLYVDGTEWHPMSEADFKSNELPDWIWTISNVQLQFFMAKFIKAHGRKNNIALASEKTIRDIEILMLRLGDSGKLDNVGEVWRWTLLTKFDGDYSDDYHWEYIKSIEDIGYHPTVCISVEDTHTYITNFVEHNSFLAAQVILWFLYTHPNSIVLNTAPTWRQVEKLIWKEIRISHSKAGDLGGTIAPKSPELQIEQDRWYASGISTNQPDRFQGWHAKDILVVIDEAAGVNEEIFDAISGVLTSENAKMLMLGNPTTIGGTFHKSFTSGEYKTFHVSAWMTPNFTHFKIKRADIIDGTWKDKIGDEPTPYPWLIQPKWVASQYKMWGLDHPAWAARIEGNFPSAGEHTLIPLDWIEAARNRGLDKDAKS